jgi:hypothetical protein
MKTRAMGSLNSSPFLFQGIPDEGFKLGIRTLDILARDLSPDGLPESGGQGLAQQAQKVGFGRDHKCLEGTFAMSFQQMPGNCAGKFHCIPLMVLKSSIETVADGARTRTREPAARTIGIKLPLGQMAPVIPHSFLEAEFPAPEVLVKNSIGAVRERVPGSGGWFGVNLISEVISGLGSHQVFGEQIPGQPLPPESGPRSRMRVVFSPT